jgi:hypothetical protein
MKKLILIFVLIVILVIGYMFIGYLFVNPILGVMMRKIKPTPEYPILLSEYKLNGFNTSPNSPWAVFAFEVEKSPERTHPSVINGTGLINLETKKSTILAPKNWIPSPNTSTFSPNGKNIVYVVKTDEKRFTNEYGNWIGEETFDMYYRDLDNEKSVKIASQIKSGDDGLHFGWMDDKNVYYGCTTMGGGYSVSAFCVIDIATLTMKVVQDDSYGAKSPTSYTDAYPAKSKLNYNGESFDGSLTIKNKCSLHMWDGCAYPTIVLVDGSKEKFIGNRETFDEYIWAYGNRLYKIFAPGSPLGNKGIQQIL